MTNEQLKDAILEEFTKVFPYGWKRGIMENPLGGTENLISFKFGLISDIALLGNIMNNDPMYHLFHVYEDKGNLVCENIISGISLKPPKNSPYVMVNLKTKYHKTKGNPEKILKSFKVFFQRLKQQVVENGENIYNYENYPYGYFRFS